MLDLGGGDGTNASHFARYIGPYCHSVCLPATLRLTEKRSKRRGWSQKIGLLAGDVNRDSWAAVPILC